MSRPRVSLKRSAGAFVLFATGLRGLRTSWLIVGMFPPEHSPLPTPRLEWQPAPTGNKKITNCLTQKSAQTLASFAARIAVLRVKWGLATKLFLQNAYTAR
jgi:hypothetical protein